MTDRSGGIRRAYATVYAARLEGRDGWLIGEAIGDLNAARRVLEEGGGSVLAIRVLGSATVIDADGTGFERPGFEGDIAKRCGWAHDEAAGCWRAPDEPITAPPTKPVWTETLAVAFAPPIHGWIDVTIAHRDAVAQIAFSYVYSPVGGMLGFLEQVAAGGFPRLVIDEEGTICEWHCFAPPEPDHRDVTIYDTGPKVRFAVFSERDGRAEAGARPSLVIDVVIQRATLVSAIYGAWLKVALGDPVRLSREWLFHILEDRDRPVHADGHLIPTEDDLLELRSAVLDRSLAR